MTRTLQVWFLISNACVRMRASRHSNDEVFMMLNSNSKLRDRNEYHLSCNYILRTNLEILTSTKIFCEERVFISSKSVLWSNDTWRIGVYLCRRDSSSVSGVNVNERWLGCVPGGGVFTKSAAVLRRSVNDLDEPNFRNGGARVTASSDERGL
jgi:hypothetical protein